MDWDGDANEDLVVAGHWMPITVFLNQGGIFKEKKELPQTHGFWYTLTTADVNLDGRQDLLAGNIGLNNKFQADGLHPLRLYVHDFDGNDTSDPIIMYHSDDRYIPLFTKGELEKQVVAIKKRYNTYTHFAQEVKGIEDLFSEAQIDEAAYKEVNELRSLCLLADGKGSFTVTPLPTEMQFSPITSFLVEDLDGDSFLDLITTGNFYDMHINLGRYDADYGSVGLGSGDSNFHYLPNHISGMGVKGQVRAARQFIFAGSRHYLFALNNDSLQLYRSENQ